MVDPLLGPVVLDLQGTELTPAEKDLLIHPQVGGIILFRRNYHNTCQLQNLVSSIRELRASLIIAVDQEGGRVQRFKEGFTVLPSMQVFGRAYAEDPQKACALAADCGWVMARELGAFDIDISFAPVLDLDDQKSDIIGDRAFAADPSSAIPLAKAFMMGMQEAGMATTGKHFPGHGGVKADSHLELPIDVRTWEELQSHDLQPFEQLLPQLDAIMAAHLLFPAIDSDPVGYSARWLRQILRTDMGFEGVVFSDDLSMEGAVGVGSFLARAERSLEAGCDAILVCNHPEKAREVVEHLERQGNVADDSLAKMRRKNTAYSYEWVKEHPRRQAFLEQLPWLTNKYSRG